MSMIFSPRRTSSVGLLLALTLLVTASGCGGSTGNPTSGPTSAVVPAPTTVPASLSAACDGSTAPPAIERIDVTVDGRPRSATVHMPATPSASTDPMPVVLSFHGVDGNASVQQATDGFVEKSDEEGFVVVYPEGLDVGLNDQVTGMTGWDADGSEVDEPAFVSAVLDDLAVKVCVDTARVFATGFSAGGNIALVVTCALPERIAAVAPVSAAYQPRACRGAPAVRTLAFHGLDDIVVPFAGRDTAAAGTLSPVRDALDARAERNGCSGGPTVTDLSPRVRRLSWSGCAASTTLIELDDHGHAWPGHPMPFPEDVLSGLFGGSDTEPPNPLMVAIGETPESMADNVLLTNSDVDATDLIWEFFSSPR